MFYVENVVGIIKDILRPLKRRLELEINNKLFSNYGQTGEDKIINQIMGHKKKGFFVDVGANHPIKINNTYKFYKKGWRGINIEPNPECIKLLKEHRPEDINLELGISDKEETLIFYKFPKNLVGSTFSKKYAKSSIEQGVYPIKSKMKVKRLETVFDKYVKRKQIDLLSIDTEGFDMKVLKSNNWKKYRPTIICIECWDSEAVGNKLARESFERFLEPKGYKIAKCIGANTVFMLMGEK